MQRKESWPSCTHDTMHYEKGRMQPGYASALGFLRAHTHLHAHSVAYKALVTLPTHRPHITNAVGTYVVSLLR